VALKPDFVEALGDLGNIYFETSRYAQAEPWYRRAIAAAPRENWVHYHNLAHALMALQRMEEASETIAKVIALDPARAEPHALQAMLYELDHRLAEARASVERALALDATNGPGLTVLAKLERRDGNAEAAIALLDRADPARMTELQRVTWYNERGRVLDRLGRYEEAFHDYTESGRALGQFRRIAYDAAPDRDQLDRLEAWVSGRLRASTLPCVEVGEGLPQPVFVLGFFRSGTTLVEQILGGHPEVAPLGELDLITKYPAAIERELGGPFPECLDKLDEAALAALLARYRDRYLADARSHIVSPTAPRYFVDKSPLYSRHIVLVRLLFPAAPILNTLRHPLDTVLSCYFENFLADLDWSYALLDTAQFYARVRQHMSIVTGLIPQGIAPVRYERLVADPETEVRAMLSFLGLEWDPRCLKFHESGRRARTASYEQVTRPIYDSSVERYRNYLPFIDPAAIAALEPAIRELGYTVEAGS
jgi:tetratricopeptide (TPR) repeat protein